MFYYHKGLTRAARRTVATAITIAGRQGCTAVDTGHLLLAMLQTGRGTAIRPVFVAGRKKYWFHWFYCVFQLGI